MGGCWFSELSTNLFKHFEWILSVHLHNMNMIIGLWKRYWYSLRENHEWLYDLKYFLHTRILIFTIWSLYVNDPMRMVSINQLSGTSYPSKLIWSLFITIVLICVYMYIGLHVYIIKDKICQIISNNYKIKSKKYYTKIIVPKNLFCFPLNHCFMNVFILLPLISYSSINI